MDESISSPELVFFCHVPKTAGTSLNSILVPRFDVRRIWPSHESRSLLNISDISYLRYIGGHMPYSLVRAIYGKNPTSLTILRNPIDRYISNLAHLRRAPSRGNSSEYQTAQYPNHVLFSDEMRHFARRYRDRQTLFLGTHLEGTVREMCDQFEAIVASDQVPSLASAQENLADFLWVGIAEYFEQSIDLLCYQLGWRPISSVPKLNRAPSESIISEAELKRIKEDNQVDLALYDCQLERHRLNYENMIKTLSEKDGEELNSNNRENVINSLERNYQRKFCKTTAATDRVHFTLDRAVFSGGWHQTEFSNIEPYRWTGEPGLAELDFRLNNRFEYQLTIRIPLSLSPESIEKLRVECNGELLQLASEHVGSEIFLKAKIESKCLEPFDNFARISFFTLPPVKVEGDDRLLGIAISWITIERIHSDKSVTPEERR